MSTISDNNEKVFEFYSVLFPELRAMVIDEMDSTDRCRFTRCSKLCGKEAKASKNYIYGLEMYVHDDQYISINFSFDKSDNYPFFNNRLMFLNSGGRWVLCKGTNNKVRIEELGDSVDLVQYAAEQFKKLLKAHQRQIKYLSFSGQLFTTRLKDYDFGIENLESLQILETTDSRNVPLYLSKLRRPLKKFHYRNGENGSILAENEQIHEVRDCLMMNDIKLTNEQMLKLSAQEVYIDISNLTEHNIANFIRSWQNGTVGKKIIEYRWNYCDHSNFDVTKLFKLLGKVFNDTAEGRRYSLKIKQNKKYGEIARLLWFKSDNQLIFRLEDDTNDTWSNKSIQELDDNYSFFLRTVSNEH